MSNARSPREVCSTTIGTSGLMFLASFACSAGFLPNVADGVARPGGPAERSGARRPELGAAALALLRASRRPQLLSRLRLFDRDRLRLAHEQLKRLAAGHVVPDGLEPSGTFELADQLVEVAPGAFGRRGERLADFVVGRLDALGLHDGGEHRLAPQRAGGLRLGLVRQLLLV